MQTEIAVTPDIAIAVARKRVGWRMGLRGWRQAAASVLALAGAVVVWYLAGLVVHSIYFPRPNLVFHSFVTMAASGDVAGIPIWQHALASLTRVAMGYAVGASIGVVVGLLMGLFPRMYTTTKVVIEPLRFIPPIAWVPLAIVLLRGTSRYIFIISLAAFWPVFINVLTGVPKVDVIFRDVFKVYGASRARIVRKVVLPSVLPDILAGMRIGLGGCWMSIVAAEMIGGENLGLGRMILNYAEILRVNDIVVGMLAIGVLGFVCNEALVRLDKHLFRWRSELKL